MLKGILQVILGWRCYLIFLFFFLIPIHVLIHNLFYYWNDHHLVMKVCKFVITTIILCNITAELKYHCSALVHNSYAIIVHVYMYSWPFTVISQPVVYWYLIKLVGKVGEALCILAVVSFVSGTLKSQLYPPPPPPLLLSPPGDTV